MGTTQKVMKEAIENAKNQLFCLFHGFTCDDIGVI